MSTPKRDLELLKSDPKVELPDWFLETELPVPVTSAILSKCGVARPTFIYWLENYTVDGEPLGRVVAGRWHVFLSRLQKFMIEGVFERKFPPGVYHERELKEEEQKDE